MGQPPSGFPAPRTETRAGGPKRTEEPDAGYRADALRPDILADTLEACFRFSAGGAVSCGLRPLRRVSLIAGGIPLSC